MPTAVFRNLTAPELVQHAMLYEADSILSLRGALVVRSYAKTGRSPADKRIVQTPDVTKDVDWGKVNIALAPESFARCKAQAVNFLNGSPRQYVVDCFAGHDPRYQIRVRVITTRPYHALFMRNMLIVPKPEQLVNFVPEYVIYNAGEADADPTIPGVTSKTSVSLNFASKEVVILGTQYAGEMKKGVLTIMFHLMPTAGHLCMHASANVGKKDKDVTVFFGLSGTGKTTLSADPNRPLIGDDEHVWTDKGVFNIEGGCYAKAIGLNPQSEFELWNAVRFGAVAENCVLSPQSKEIDFYDESICKNTRVAYPLSFIDNALEVAVAGHPKNIVFLTNDAFGVMPPVARLNEGQAMFWFITGYTANVAGVVAGGASEPTPTFSACFGAPFLVRHPTVYGRQLAEKMAQHNAKVWLVNTGYSGGAYGKGGKRMKLSITRAILDQIHNGTLLDVPYETFTGWGIAIPKTARHPAIPDAILNPVNTWADRKAFYAQLNKLAEMFQENFKKRFADKADKETAAAVPQVIAPPSNL